VVGVGEKIEKASLSHKRILSLYIYYIYIYISNGIMGSYVFKTIYNYILFFAVFGQKEQSKASSDRLWVSLRQALTVTSEGHLEYSYQDGRESGFRGRSRSN
jgi:hypothetical protein